MKARWVAVCLTVAPGLLPGQAAPAGAAATQPPSLNTSILFRETQGSDTLAKILFSGAMVSIDAQSNIAVVIAPTPGTGVPNPTVAGVQAAEHLTHAVDQVTKGYGTVLELLRLPKVEADSISPAWVEIAAQNAGYFAEFSRSATAYINTLRAAPQPELRAHAEVFRMRLFNTLATGDPDVPFGSGPAAATAVRASKVPDFLQQELVWLNDWLKARTDSVLRGSPELYLSATLNHRGALTPIGIPGYNDTPIGSEVPFTRIHAPTSDDIAEMQAALPAEQQIAASWNALVTSKADVRSVLATMGIDLAALSASFKAAIAKFVSPQGADSLTKLAADVTTGMPAAVANASKAEKATLASIQKNAGEITTSAAAVVASLKSIATQVAALDPAVTAANLKAQNDPVQALVLLLGYGSDAINLAAGSSAQLQKLSADVTTAANGAIAITDSLRALAAEIDTLTPATAAPLTKAASGQLLTNFEPLSQIVIQLKNELGPIVNAVNALRNPTLAGLLAKADTPPPSSHPVSLASLLATTIPITTVARHVGDVVTVQAWLYQRDKADSTKRSLIETKTQPFAITSYGWSTSAMVGVAYTVGTFVPQGQTQNTRAFAPHVSWILGYKPRGGAFDGQTVVGVGLHAMTFDLDKDNQMEIGVGVTGALLSDALVFGVGQDLTLNKTYWFIGTRLLQLAQQLGAGR